MHSRKLRIYKKFQARSYGNTTIPEIRLKGKWLEKLGFIQGQVINVIQEENKLTITIDKEKE